MDARPAKRRRPTAAELFGDDFEGVRITLHAARRWVERVRPKVLRRLVKEQLNGVCGDVFEAMITTLSRARYAGMDPGREGRLFRDGGLLYILIPYRETADPETAWLVTTCIWPRRRNRRSKGRADLDIAYQERRAWRAKRAAMAAADARAVLREAG